MLNYLKQPHQKNNEECVNFYTPTGIHVYIKDLLVNDSIDVERVINKVESTIPEHLLAEVEMIIVGWFEEFEKQDINAFYRDNALYISNIQDDEADMYDDIVHEIAHAAEEVYGYEIYGDELVKEEFLRKRKYLHDILWEKGFRAPEAFFMNLEYDKEFDEFLHKKVGYAKLSPLIQGIFLTPYSPTSIREYFATAFTDYFLHHEERKYLQKLSPQLYKKIIRLRNPETLDNAF